MSIQRIVTPYFWAACSLVSPWIVMDRTITRIFDMTKFWELCRELATGTNPQFCGVGECLWELCLDSCENYVVNYDTSKRTNVMNQDMVLTEPPPSPYGRVGFFVFAQYFLSG